MTFLFYIHAGITGTVTQFSETEVSAQYLATLGHRAARRYLSILSGLHGGERFDALPGGPSLHWPALHLRLARFPNRDLDGVLARPGTADLRNLELHCAAPDGLAHAAAGSRL